MVASRHPLPKAKRVPLYQLENHKELPSITIVIPAYNEEKWIADKIRNCAVLDYPRGKLEVIIINDGSTDNTIAVAEETIQEAYAAIPCLGSSTIVTTKERYTDLISTCR